MVLNSHHSLTASTTLASVVSAAILTAVGLCIPYTERAAKNRTAPPSSFSQAQRAAPAEPLRNPGAADAPSGASRRSAEPVPH